MTGQAVALEYENESAMVRFSSEHQDSRAFIMYKSSEEICRLLGWPAVTEDVANK